MRNLQYFQTLPFIQALKQFFRNLQVPVSYFGDKPAKPQDVLGEYYNLNKDGIGLVDDVYVLGMVDDAAFRNNKSNIANADDAAKLKSDYDGLLVFGITLKKRKDGLLPARTHLAEITRAFNRAFPYTPVTAVFQYHDYISLANAERQPYKNENKEGEKVGKVSLLKDVSIVDIHRGHYDIFWQSLRYRQAAIRRLQGLNNCMRNGRKYYQRKRLINVFTSNCFIGTCGQNGALLYRRLPAAKHRIKTRLLPSLLSACLHGYCLCGL